METVDILVSNSDWRAVEDCAWRWYKTRNVSGAMLPERRNEPEGRVLLTGIPRAALPLLTERGIQFEVTAVDT